MKKILLIIGSLSLLVGCTSGSADIKDRDDMLVKVGDTTITKGQIYDMMFVANGANQIINDTVKKITDTEVEVTEELTEKAKSIVEMQKTIYQDQFAAMMVSGGYKDEQDYIDRAIMPSLKVEALVGKYVTENQASIFETYKPRKVQVMAFAEETLANEALTQINGGSVFLTVATDKKSTVDANEKVVTSKSEYPLDVKLFIENATEPSTSEVIFDEEGSSYYIVKVTNTDPTSFVEDSTKAIASIQEISEKALTHYISSYSLEVFDQNLYDQIKQAFPDYIK